VATIAGMSGPAPVAPPTFDPGPAVPATEVRPATVPSEPRVPEPASRLATEIVDRPGMPVPPTASVPPTAAVPAGPVAPIDPDRTWTPGDHRADDATRTPGGRWTDLEAAPAVGPVAPAERPRRSGLVTLPLAAFAVAAGSAAPLLVIGLVVLVVLPVLATVGDAVARRQRAAQGFAAGRAERMPSGVVVPSRFIRNLVTSVLRTSPIVGVSAVFLGCWYALDQTSLPQSLLDVVLRVIGGGTIWLLLLGAREGSNRFRSGLGIDRLVERISPTGRIDERIVVLWLLAAIGVAAALWLTPDAFPLP
jgi:hypothetical protein